MIWALTLQIVINIRVSWKSWIGQVQYRTLYSILNRDMMVARALVPNYNIHTVAQRQNTNTNNNDDDDEKKKKKKKKKT